MWTFLRQIHERKIAITSLQDLSGTRSYASTSYQYDNLYRLTRASTTLATTTDWLETYTYNDLGNLLTKSDVGSYTYAGTGFANPHAPTTIIVVFPQNSALLILQTSMQ